jgi:hypothetical protein
MPTTETPFRLDGPLRRVPAIGPLALDLAERALAFERLANIYRQLSREHTTAAGFAARALETLQVHFEIMCDCPVTPVHFGGGNGAVFQTLGLLHPRMRTALLSRELLGHRHRNIPVTIGRAIPAERIRDQPDDAILASSLRLATYALEARQVRLRRLEREMAPVDAAVPTALLEAEIGCLDASQSLATLAQLARPRRPFRRTHSLAALGGDLARLSSVEELSRLVEEMEPDGKGVPVLLRQYLKLGARMVGFNVDRSFGDVVDAMIVVDLLRTEPRTLQKYMGKAQAEKFLARERSAA